MEPVEIIREARNLLFERGWCQRALQNRDGEVCALGAVAIATHGDTTSSVTREELAAVWMLSDVCGEVITVFNNAPGRTFGEVVDVFDKAEKIAESRGVGGVS